MVFNLVRLAVSRCRPIMPADLGIFGNRFTRKWFIVHVRMCVPLCVCVAVCESVYTITQKNNGSIHLKLEHIVEYENTSDEFDIGHCPIKVKVTA